MALSAGLLLSFEPIWGFSLGLRLTGMAIVPTHTGTIPPGGILASSQAIQRTHRVGPTPVELYGNYYGTLPSLQNQYWLCGHG